MFLFQITTEPTEHDYRIHLRSIITSFSCDYRIHLRSIITSFSCDWRMHIKN